MPIGWLCYISLTPTYSFILYGNVIFVLDFYDLLPLFLEYDWGAKQGLGI
jgi:hypothetical protein